MEAAVREKSVRNQMPFSSTDSEKSYYTVDEFMDKLAERLGKHYGLNDIREAL